MIKEIMERVSQIDRVSKDFNKFRDQPGYEIGHGGRLMRINVGVPGITAKRLAESGFQSGKWRKARAR